MGPTHKQGHTLNLVISKGLNNISLDVAISDHFCIFFNMTSVLKSNSVVRFKNKSFIHDNTSDMFIYEYTKHTTAHNVTM